MRPAADHTASISSLFTHSNNGKHESPSTAAVDQELDTLSQSAVCSCSETSKQKRGAAPPITSYEICKKSSSSLFCLFPLPPVHFTSFPSFSPGLCLILSFFTAVMHSGATQRANAHTHTFTHPFPGQTRAQAHSCRYIHKSARAHRRRALSTQSSPVC